MTSRPFQHDTRAEVGIGTMIVFIASILVAAIASGVLIASSQKLQAKSLDTGNQATQNIVGTLTVLNVKGLRSGTADTDYVDQLDLTVQMAAGADPLDLGALIVHINDGSNEVTINTCALGGSVGNNTEYAMTVARGNISDCGSMVSGNLVYLHFGLAGASPIPVVPGGIDSNTRVQIRIVPAFGTPVLVRFTMPPLGAGQQIEIL